MDNMIFAFTAVFPLFALAAVGYMMRKLKWFDEVYVSKTNKFCFRVCLPVMLFYNIYINKVDVGENAKLISFGIVGVFAIALAASVIVPFFVRKNERRSVMIQAIFRSNCLLFGMPAVINLFGEKGAAPMALVIAAVIPLFNVIAVVILCIFDPKGQNKIDILRILKGIAKNPLIIAAVVGVIAVYVGVQMPEAIEDAVAGIAKLASPLALIALGANFDFRDTAGNGKLLSAGVALRLIIVPGILIAAAAALGFRGPQLGALLLLFASPVAVTSYVMSCDAGADGALAAQFVVFSTALVSITLFGFIWILRSLQLI